MLVYAVSIQIICIFIIITNLVNAYPTVFGTTRYSRSLQQQEQYQRPQTLLRHTSAAPQWLAPTVYRRHNTNNYPPAYYETLYNPYEYLDYYYYPSEQRQYTPPAPFYYVPSAAIKYPYVTALPWHYAYANEQGYRQAKPEQQFNPYSTYYDSNELVLPRDEPIDDLHDAMLDEQPIDSDEDNLPIGQETWYDTDNNNNDDVNEIFLQNLIMSHMYNDARANKHKEIKDKNMEGYISADQTSDYLNDDDTSTSNWYTEKYDYDDSEVQQLKNLQQTNHKKTDSKLSMDPNDSDMYINWNNKRVPIANKKQELTEHGIWAPLYKKLTIDDRKQFVASSSSSTERPPTTSTMQSTVKPPEKMGQKEFVLLRPATPVRHPFAEPIMDLLSQQQSNEIHNSRDGDNEKDNDKRENELIEHDATTKSPKLNVYETIKQLLYMENNLKQNTDSWHRQDNNGINDEIDENNQQHHTLMKKRFVSDEGSLVHELKQLKKMST